MCSQNMRKRPLRQTLICETRPPHSNPKQSMSRRPAVRPSEAAAFTMMFAVVLFAGTALLSALICSLGQVAEGSFMNSSLSSFSDPSTLVASSLSASPAPWFGADLSVSSGYLAVGSPLLTTSSGVARDGGAFLYRRSSGFGAGWTAQG